MTATTLITAEQLCEALASITPPVLIDVSFDLADPQAGESAWRAGHLPGSLYLHLDRDLCGPKTGHNGRHPLPARADFAATLGRCGISPATPVVALDRQGGMYAARLWWMLRWMGHAAVAVLDGGLGGWTAIGGTLAAGDAGTAATAAPAYPAQASLVDSVDAQALAQKLGRTRLIDARAAERFRGDVEPLDAAAGHIPGALNRFFKDNLCTDGRFKPAAQLHAEFSALLGVWAAEGFLCTSGTGGALSGHGRELPPLRTAADDAAA